jgi:hypothetical protein
LLAELSVAWHGTHTQRVILVFILIFDANGVELTRHWLHHF